MKADGFMETQETKENKRRIFLWGSLSSFAAVYGVRTGKVERSGQGVDKG